MAAFDFIESNILMDAKASQDFRDLLRRKPKLNLGSNIDCRATHINVDIMDFPELDLRCDIKNLHKYIPANSMQEVLAYDVLEHFPFAETKQLLADWVCWLAPKGTIIVRTPDLSRLADALLNKKLPVYEVQRLLYGGQEYQFNFHMAGFTSDYLEGLILGAGCSEILQIVQEPDSFNCTVVAKK